MLRGGTTTDMLREEHRIILRAVDVLESAAGRLASGGELPSGWWQGMIDWFASFADRHHHAAEERILFPALVQAGVPSRDGPIAIMLDDHEEGRALIRAMSAGSAERRAELAGCYIQLLRDHIDKEDSAVFPLADAALDERARRALDAQVEALDPVPGQAAARAESEIDRLAASLG